MGVLEKLPTFLTVGVLVIIFVCLKRQARSARLTLWTVGWTLVFIHFLMQLLEPDHAAVSSLLSAIDSGSLQAAAVVFLVSVSVLVEDYAKRTLLLLVLGVPSFAYVACDGYGVQARWLFVLCLIACFGGAAFFFFRVSGKWSLSLAAVASFCSLAGAWAIRAAWGGSFEEGTVALLGIGFGLSGVFICRGQGHASHAPLSPSLLSPAMLTIAGGFFCWGAVFPIGLLLDRVAPAFIVPVELWDAPKFFVAFGMILAVVEAKSESITGMQHKAAALNCQLERFSTITSRLLGGGRPDAICPGHRVRDHGGQQFQRGSCAAGRCRAQAAGCRPQRIVGGLGRKIASSNRRLDSRPHQDFVFASARHGQKLICIAPGRNDAVPSAQKNGRPPAERRNLNPTLLRCGACLGCIRLAAPRDPSMIDALELSRIEMLAGDLAVAVELKALHTQLIWSEKLAALGQLLAGVAHELNNPLTVIMGYGELVGDAITAPNARDQLAKLVNEARRMKRIIENLLRFSRQSARDTQTVQLSPIVQEVLALREYYTRTRSVRVQLDIASDLPSLAVNEDEIKQILLNLVNNSSDAMEGMAGSKQISIRAYQNGPRAVIEVGDTGPGFGNLSRALDPFYTTKPVGKGTGLGLSVCYGIVKERGGDLRIENVEPHGALVTIELPVADAQAHGFVAAVAHA